MEGSVIYCNSCQIEIESDVERNSHYKSQWHRYNVKRKVKGLACVSLELFQKKLDLLSGNSAKRDSDEEKEENSGKVRSSDIKAKNMLYKCKLCGNSFKSQNALDNHIGSLKHRKALALADLSARKLNDPSYLEDPIQKIENPGNSEQETKEENYFDPDNYDLTQAIPVGACLFCPKSNFDSKEECLAHMSLEHGFVIPFLEHIVDVDGMLEYLGAKIGVGKICLYCNGKGKARFSTVEAVRLHMCDKGHCKVLWDDDDEEFEFDEYYEFPDVDENRNYVIGINALGELMLRDGTVLGNREMLVYYKQRLRRPTDVELTDRKLLECKSGNSSALVPTMSSKSSSAIIASGVLKWQTRMIKHEKKAYDKLKAIEFRKQLKVGMVHNQQKHFRAQYLF